MGLFVILVGLLSSCRSTKQMVYFQDIDHVQLEKIMAEYEPKIKKDDKLNIVVTGINKEAVMPYNLTLSENVTGGSQGMLLYTVDAKGEIEFPGFGKIKVEGMTRTELVKHLTELLQSVIKNPLVVINFENFRITVLGEVNGPGTYTVNSERLTLLQALGMAGDLKNSAKRDDILLIREVNGRHEHARINLKNSDILSSPYFYLQQNDVLYVTPTKANTAQSTMYASLITTAFSFFSMVTTIVLLVF